MLVAELLVRLHVIDWTIIGALMLIVLAVGVAVARRSGKDASQYFLSGRGMPWWLLGISMVATTFAADTPNFVTDVVRTKGVAGNWVWWAFLLTGMLTVFNYAKLWRRSELLTDLEFYEIRYSGPAAAVLRGFRAIYLGIFFNVMVMSVVMLAAIKMGQVMLGLSPMQSVLGASSITIVFSTLGGFRGVVLTDCLLFVLAMTGSIAAAVIAVNHPSVGGLQSMLEHELVRDKIAMLPRVDWNDAEATNTLVAMFLVPLAVQWWSVWYPGAEPGGGGYLAQRMLAARTPRHATAAVFLFNAAHYALRPWPWILVALASLIVFPELSDLRQAFPHVAEDKIGHDLAYPAMLTMMPAGWLGVVLASLLAAFMSTISTHLNWGASYVVNDVYKRFVNPAASERQQVRVGRISAVLMMVAAGTMALYLRTATQGFQLLLQVGAGTGLLFILRWFWWRINAYCEIVAMVVSFVLAIVFAKFGEQWELQEWMQLCLGVGITTACWLLTAYIAPAESQSTLESFCRLVRPAGPGWRPVYQGADAEGRPIPAPDSNDNLPLGILRMFLGCVAVYAALFATGLGLFSRLGWATTWAVIGVVAMVVLARTYRGRTE